MSEHGLRVGAADVRSAGPITFGPDGVLFLADNISAKVFAVDVADPGPEAGSEPFDLENVDVRVGSFLGCQADDVIIRDMAVHPVSHNVYLSVQRGHGDAGQAVLVRIDYLDGSITDVPLDHVPVAEVPIADAPAPDDERQDITLPQGAEGKELQIGERTIRILRRPIRTSTVTDMAYVDGTLLIAGLSNEEFSSKLRRIPFPFSDEVTGSNLEIFTSRTASGRRRRRSARSCPMTAAGASWLATRALRSCISRWPTWYPGPRLWAARSPSSAP